MLHQFIQFQMLITLKSIKYINIKLYKLQTYGKKVIVNTLTV